MRDLASDAQKAIASLLFGAALPFLIFGALLMCAYAYGKSSARGQYNVAVTALRDTIRLTDSIIVTRTDTVVKYQRRVDTVKARSDALDSVVQITSDSTAVVQVSPDSSITESVPPLVIADLRALRLTVATQDTLIRALYGRDSTQEWRIATHKKLIAELSRPQICGRRCGFVLGVGASVLVYRAVK